jgi:hypothetical protein
MEAADWKEAASLSKALKDATIEERDRTLGASGQERLNRVLDALPDDTETIAVAQQPFTLTERKQTLEPGALSMARGYVLGLLAAPDDQMPFKALVGSTLQFGVLAARNFGMHPPDGSQALPLGMIAYQGCAAYAFAGPVAQLAFPRPPDTIVLGQPVWNATGKQYAQARDATPTNETYWLALPKPELIVVCNNKEFFSSVLSKLAKPSGVSKLKATPEWKQVDRTAPFWALRHFTPENEATDPTRPRDLGLIGVNDKDATGMVFQVGSPAGKVQARWLSSSKDNPWSQVLEANEQKGAATSRQIAGGVWEISANDQMQSGWFMVFAAMAMLGFVVMV